MGDRLLAVAILAGAALLSPPGVAAQNHTCGTAHPTAVDTEKTFTLDDDTAIHERWFRFTAVGTRSYCVEALGHGSEMSDYWDTTLGLFGPDSCVASIGTNDDTLGEEPSLYYGSRVCFVRAATGTVAARVAQYEDDLIDFAEQAFRLRVVETTLFSPYFQVVTAAGFDAAPQIKNNTGTSVQVFFTTYDAAGTAAGCVGTPFVVPANGMTTFAISSQCGLSSAFGAAQIAHDGPPGALSANITTFSGMSGLSFDAEFEVREKNVPVN